MPKGKKNTGVAKVPCHAVRIAGSPEAARRDNAPRVDARTGCQNVVAGRRMGVTKIDPRVDLGANTTGKPCMQKRRGCPVQLVFKKGVPHLRFCRQAGNKQPGFLIEAGGPQEALERAASICKRWEANGRSFEGLFPPDQQLGGAKRRRAK